MTSGVKNNPFEPPPYTFNQFSRSSIRESKPVSSTDCLSSRRENRFVDTFTTSSGIWWPLTLFCSLFSFIFARIWRTHSSAQVVKLPVEWREADLPGKLAFLYNLRVDRSIAQEALLGKFENCYQTLPPSVKRDLDSYLTAPRDLAYHFSLFRNWESMTDVDLPGLRSTVGQFADYLETYAGYVYPQAAAFLRDCPTAPRRERLFWLYLLNETKPRNGDTDSIDQVQAFRSCYKALNEDEKTLIRKAYSLQNPNVDPANVLYIDSLILRKKSDLLRLLIAKSISSREVIELIQDAQKNYRGARIRMLLKLLKDFNLKEYQDLLTIEIDTFLTADKGIKNEEIDREVEREQKTYSDPFTARFQFYLKQRGITLPAKEEEHLRLELEPLDPRAQHYVNKYLYSLVGSPD